MKTEIPIIQLQERELQLKNDDDIIIYILNRDDSWSVNYRDKSRRAECRKLYRKKEFMNIMI